MLGHELHCVWDSREIPEDRARKGAITCCGECKRQYANYRRRIRAQVKCRLCGRGRRRNSKLDPMLIQHTGLAVAILKTSLWKAPAATEVQLPSLECARKSGGGNFFFGAEPVFQFVAVFSFPAQSVT